MRNPWLLIPLFGSLGLASIHLASASALPMDALKSSLRSTSLAAPARFVARGPRGAVVAGPRGAYVRRPGGIARPAVGAYRVGGRYYGGVWYGAGVRRYYRGRWWPYGVGACWRSTPVGYVWICG